MEERRKESESSHPWMRTYMHAHTRAADCILALLHIFSFFHLTSFSPSSASVSLFVHTTLPCWRCVPEHNKPTDSHSLSSRSLFVFCCFFFIYFF